MKARRSWGSLRVDLVTLKCELTGPMEGKGRLM